MGRNIDGAELKTITDIFMSAECELRPVFQRDENDKPTKVPAMTYPDGGSYTRPNGQIFVLKQKLPAEMNGGNGENIITRLVERKLVTPGTPYTMYAPPEELPGAKPTNARVVFNVFYRDREMNLRPVIFEKWASRQAIGWKMRTPGGLYEQDIYLAKGWTFADEDDWHAKEKRALVEAKLDAERRASRDPIAYAKATLELIASVAKGAPKPAVATNG